MQSKNKQSNIHSVVAKLGNDKDSDYLKEPKKKPYLFSVKLVVLHEKLLRFQKKKNIFPLVLKTVLSKYRLKNFKCLDLTRDGSIPGPLDFKIRPYSLLDNAHN